MGNIKKKVKQIVTGKCQFSDFCGEYKSDSITCNKEAGPYCGQYRFHTLA